MAAAVWDRQYAGMESGESFQRSGPADCEGICLGNEKFINLLIGSEERDMVMEALVYILTLLFGVSTVIIIKNKRYKVVPFICLDIILTFAGFAITSFVILF